MKKKNMNKNKTFRSLARLLVTFNGKANITKIQDIQSVAKTFQYLSGAAENESFQYVMDAVSDSDREIFLDNDRNHLFSANLSEPRLKQIMLALLRAVRKSGGEMLQLTALFRNTFCSQEKITSKFTNKFCRIEDRLVRPLERRRALKSGKIFFKEAEVHPSICINQSRRLVA